MNSFELLKTMKNRFLSLLTLPLTLGFLTACGGGGGGGGDFAGAATVTLDVQPSQIDTGDRAQVSTQVGDVHSNGIALKFRYPPGLKYVHSSAFLSVQDKDYDISPTVNVASNEDDAIYLIFYMPQKLFTTSGEEYNGQPGTVTFQLVGRSEVDDGLDEVDAVVDDSATDNSVEFDLANPEFVAEDQASISVVVGK